MFNPRDVHLGKVTCPYDSAHVIDAYRFQVHLSRCRKNHPISELQRCPFNTTHMVYGPEMDWHVKQCPNRDLFEQFKNTIASSTRCVPEPVTEMPKIETSEDWDDDPPVESYNPRSYVESAPVLRQCNNAPPAIRKQFRKKEHMRLAGMDKP